MFDLQAFVVVNDVCSGLCYDGNLLIGTKCLWNLFTKLFTNDLAAHDAATAKNLRTRWEEDDWCFAEKQGGSHFKVKDLIF